MTSALLPAVLAGAAAALVVARAPARRLPTPPSAAPGLLAGRSRLGPRGACAVLGAAAVLVLGPAVGGAVALLALASGPPALARLETAAARRERELLARDAPLLLDLVAACLTGGASLVDAAGAVASAVGGPAGARLAAVRAALLLGTPPGEAWAALAPSADDPLAPAARALARAAEGGAPVAGAVARSADDARAEVRATAEQAARRVGVLVVAPLGLCFLPAFVLLGVVPVVVALAAPVLRGL